MGTENENQILNYLTYDELSNALNTPIVAYFADNKTNTHNVPAGKTGNGIILSNDSTDTDLTFTINGITSTLKFGEVFEANFDDFSAVIVTTTVAYRLWIKGV